MNGRRFALEWNGTTAERIHGTNIENIADYERVFHIIKEYNNSIYSDTMYPNDLRPGENHGYNTKYIPGD